MAKIKDMVTTQNWVGENIHTQQSNNGLYPRHKIEILTRNLKTPIKKWD